MPFNDFQGLDVDHRPVLTELGVKVRRRMLIPIELYFDAVKGRYGWPA
jgi:hypothetical protein